MPGILVVIAKPFNPKVLASLCKIRNRPATPPPEKVSHNSLHDSDLRNGISTSGNLKSLEFGAQAFAADPENFRSASTVPGCVLEYR